MRQGKYGAEVGGGSSWIQGGVATVGTKMRLENGSSDIRSLSKDVFGVFLINIGARVVNGNEVKLSGFRFEF